MQSPYSFPHRSRKAMIEYLLDRDGYSPFPFSWNVKARNVNWEHPKGDYKLNPELDSEWLEYVQTNPENGPEWWAFEAAQSQYEKDWSSYLGDDQGNWKFGFAGRSGGHLCLLEWCDRQMDGKHFSPEDLDDWSVKGLREFYRGIRCADSDFTPANATKNVEYQLNFIRSQWEQDKLDAQAQFEADMAREITESRPDMYGKESAS